MIVVVPILALAVAFALWRSGHRWASLGCLATLVLAGGIIGIWYLILTAGD